MIAACWQGLLGLPTIRLRCSYQEKDVFSKVFPISFFIFKRKYFVDFANKTDVYYFSLLPAPLHVPYRERDEDDDLEKAYKEVSVLCSRPCLI